jgi:predicted nucleic acid-binding protein
VLKMYLFDASAIINLVKREYLKPFIDGATLDLAIYESLNAIWKEYLLLHHLDDETVKRLLSILRGIFSVVSIASISGYEYEVFELAVKEKLTVYDAAYLYYAAKNKLILVTDDARLREKVKQYLETVSTRELMHE